MRSIVQGSWLMIWPIETFISPWLYFLLTAFITVNIFYNSSGDVARKLSDDSRHVIGSSGFVSWEHLQCGQPLSQGLSISICKSDQTIQSFSVGSRGTIWPIVAFKSLWPLFLIDGSPTHSIIQHPRTPMSPTHFLKDKAVSYKLDRNSISLPTNHRNQNLYFRVPRTITRSSRPGIG